MFPDSSVWSIRIRRRLHWKDIRIPQWPFTHNDNSANIRVEMVNKLFVDSTTRYRMPPKRLGLGWDSLKFSFHSLTTLSSANHVVLPGICPDLNVAFTIKLMSIVVRPRQPMTEALSQRNGWQWQIYKLEVNVPRTIGILPAAGFRSMSIVSSSSTIKRGGRHCLGQQEPITLSLHLPYILGSTFARIFLFL